jgi:hypothetical protein
LLVTYALPWAETEYNFNYFSAWIYVSQLLLFTAIFWSLVICTLSSFIVLLHVHFKSE